MGLGDRERDDVIYIESDDNSGISAVRSPRDMVVPARDKIRNGTTGLKLTKTPLNHKTITILQN